MLEYNSSRLLEALHQLESSHVVVSRNYVVFKNNCLQAYSAMLTMFNSQFGLQRLCQIVLLIYSGCGVCGLRWCLCRFVVEIDVCLSRLSDAVVSRSSAIFQLQRAKDRKGTRISEYTIHVLQVNDFYFNFAGFDPSSGVLVIHHISCSAF